MSNHKSRHELSILWMWGLCLMLLTVLLGFRSVLNDGMKMIVLIEGYMSGKENSG